MHIIKVFFNLNLFISPFQISNLLQDPYFYVNFACSPESFFFQSVRPFCYEPFWDYPLRNYVWDHKTQITFQTNWLLKKVSAIFLWDNFSQTEYCLLDETVFSIRRTLHFLYSLFAYNPCIWNVFLNFSDSAQSPYGAELEQRNKPLQNGIGQDDHLKNQDGLEITIHEAMPRDEAGTMGGSQPLTDENWPVYISYKHLGTQN